MVSRKKVVLVTGCSSGFGFLTALTFARRGYWTFASVRNLDASGAKRLVEVGSSEDLPLEVVRIDVDNDGSVSDGVLYTKTKAERIDILVNNAGLGFSGPVEDLGIEEVKKQYETNIFGVLRMIKAVLPIMRAQNAGKIINISSIAGLVTFPLNGVYASSKQALESLSEALSFELSHFGIKVVLVEPGSFPTSFMENSQYPLGLGKETSPYKSLVDNFFQRSQKSYHKVKSRLNAKLADPQNVANLLYRIAGEKNPRLRYLVGIDAHLYYWLRRILPYPIWERLLRKVYNW